MTVAFAAEAVRAVGAAVVLAHLKKHASVARAGLTGATLSAANTRRRAVLALKNRVLLLSGSAIQYSVPPCFRQRLRVNTTGAVELAMVKLVVEDESM